MSQLIYENEHVEVIHRPGPANRTLVTYSWAGFPANGRNFWAQPIAEKLDINAIGFVTKSPNWFFPAAMQEAIKAAQEYIAGTVVSYGSSMGAFGALKYSRLMRSNCTIALSPQYSIDPAITPHTRYQKFFKADWHRGVHIEETDIAGRCYVALDPHYEEDVIHFNLIRSFPGIVPIQVNYVNHDTVFVVGRTSSVERMLNLALTDDRAGLFQLFRERKKVEPWSIRSFAVVCQEHGRYKAAKSLLDRAEAYGLPASVLGELRFALFQEEGRFEDAAAVAETAIGMPNLPMQTLLRMLGVLRQVGRPKVVAAACQAAIARGQDRQDLHEELARALRALGRHADAAAALEGAIKRWPANQGLVASLAWAWLAAGKLDLALEAFESLAARQPEAASFQIGQLDCLRRMGRLGDASAAAREALARFPENPEIRRWGCILLDAPV